MSVASRHLNIALSELQYLRESWQSIMLTATALAKFWDGSQEFQQMRGRKSKYLSDELVVDGRLMDPEQSYKIYTFSTTGVDLESILTVAQKGVVGNIIRDHTHSFKDIHPPLI